jgi:hypothetical protein
MINMCVRQDDGIKFIGPTAKMCVARTGLIVAALKQTTVQQDAARICLNQVLAASDLAGSSQKRNLHSGKDFPAEGRNAL